jgi:predicted nucleotidyltransferase
MAKKPSKSPVKTRALGVVKDYLQNLKEEINVEKVILFGSAARGEMHRDSDIDLIIISPDFKKMGYMRRLILLSRLRRGMKKTAPMDILGYTRQEFNKLAKESIVLKEAKKEGVEIKL